MPDVNAEKEAAILTCPDGALIRWTPRVPPACEPFMMNGFGEPGRCRQEFSTEERVVNILFPCVAKGCERKVA